MVCFYPGVDTFAATAAMIRSLVVTVLTPCMVAAATMYYPVAKGTIPSRVTLVPTNYAVVPEMTAFMSMVTTQLLKVVMASTVLMLLVLTASVLVPGPVLKQPSVTSATIILMGQT